jgi:hypothetical protein
MNKELTAEDVIVIIEKIPGDKKIALFSPDSDAPWTWIEKWPKNVTPEWLAFLAVFKAKLNSAMNSEGGNMVIQRVLTPKTSILYGITFNKGEMAPMTPEWLERIMEHRCATGEYIGKQDGLEYGDITEFFGEEGQ